MNTKFSNKTLFALSLVLGLVAVLISFLLLRPQGKTDEQKAKNTVESRPCLPRERKVAISDPEGPSFHQVLMARSLDGLNWQTDGKVLIDQASVPEGVQFPNGRLAIYAVDGSGLGGPGLVYAESKDEGNTWTCRKVNFQGVGADPDIVFLPDGKMRLFSIQFPFKPGQQPGPPVPSQSQEPNSVKSAVSSDGKNFRVEEGGRLQGLGFTDPDVIKVGQEWFMYISSGRTAIAARSSNGLKFEPIGKVNETGAVSGSYVFSDGKIRHYYCGQEGIESALSDTGGSVWEKEAGARISNSLKYKVICDPSIVPDGTGGYLMFYKVQPK